MEWRVARAGEEGYISATPFVHFAIHSHTKSHIRITDQFYRHSFSLKAHLQLHYPYILDHRHSAFNLHVFRFYIHNHD